MQKIALVTGAAGGIGRAVAKRFVDRGVSVALVDLSAKGLDAAAKELEPVKPVEVRQYTVDISDAGQVVDCVHKAAENLGGINYLVNCAGISTSNLIVDIPLEDWDRVFAVNTRSVFLFCREAAKIMIAKRVKDGRIVSISSQASKIGELGNGAYSASKASINSLTQVLGLELAKYGIAVTAICPGYVDTEMMQKVFRERGPIEGMTPEQYKQKLLSTVPSGSMVAPSEVAGLVAYLCSSEAGSITGVTVTIAGGKTII